MGKDFVIPVAVKLVASKSDAREFLVGDFGSRRVDAVIDFGVNLQTLHGGCGGNQIDDDFEAEERLSSPVLADEAKKPMLDFVPLVPIPAKEIGYSELMPIIFRLSEAKQSHVAPLIDMSQERRWGGGEWL